MAGAAVIIAVAGFFLWRLELRHHRTYVTLTHNGRMIDTLVDVPTKAQSKASVVVLVHEVYGLSDWAGEMADDLADKGFIVVAPDFLSGYGPNGGGFSDFPSEGDRVSAVQNLNDEGVMADLDAAIDYGKKLPGANGKVTVVGFSWGGWKSFAFATRRKDLSAVFVFYGTGPTDVTTITAPVFGFYGGKDPGVSGTVPATADAMKAAGKSYESVTYEGADHGFMRLAGEFANTNSDNRTARDQAFARLVMLLSEMGPRTGPPQ
ncbi:dienelactone hydrolase family protein [Acidicapsa acidisoli]|uniref:dienelactone hydrolase family protein n=1 Tax=Acidicapsa acidisoli TaxID=1615681 RepID=UPI0021E07D80|nr:dienelactone hydrolase family protein [Acidicapsa acidisoli]